MAMKTTFGFLYVKKSNLSRRPVDVPYAMKISLPEKEDGRLIFSDCPDAGQILELGINRSSHKYMT
jgi:hypothetical protein